MSEPGPLPPPPADRSLGTGGPEVLWADECWRLLRSGSVARIGFVAGGWPVLVPVNYVVDGGRIVVRTAPDSLLASIADGAPVALETDEADTLYRSGWSVLMYATARVVAESDERARLASLGLRPWAAGDRTCWITLEPLQISGRRLPRAWAYPGRT